MSGYVLPYALNEYLVDLFLKNFILDSGNAYDAIEPYSWHSLRIVSRTESIALPEDKYSQTKDTFVFPEEIAESGTTVDHLSMTSCPHSVNQSHECIFITEIGRLY